MFRASKAPPRLVSAGNLPVADAIPCARRSRRTPIACLWNPPADRRKSERHHSTKKRSNVSEFYAENLKPEQRFRLRDLLRYNLKSVRAYLLREAFQQLWEIQLRHRVAKFLDG